MTGKNFVIAGGSSGIGKALAERLLLDGNSVTVLSRHANGVPEQAQHRVWDALADNFPDDMPEVIHGCAYLPGSINLRMFRSLKPTDFQHDFDINVLGAVRFLQKMHPGLKAAQTASVLLFSTVAVSQGMPFHASIAAAKGAVEGLTRSLAAEWAPSVRVNAIAPSLVETPMAARLLDTDAKKEASAKRHPLARFGKAEDIADLAAFLLSEQAAWISGQVIGVDGGMSSLRTQHG
jgi:3-oxoacyl-[acyl-carrier protein] reductase